MAQIANVLHPAFLRLLQQIIVNCNDVNKYVGMCGEMAGNNEYLPLLVGMGINELSMSIPAIPGIKHQVTKLNYLECQELVLNACKSSTVSEVKQLLDKFNNNKNEQLLSESLIALESNAITKSLALKEAVSLLKLSNRANNPDIIEEALWAREDTYATGIGYAVAIPHCKTKDVSHSSVCIIKLNNPIAWGSIDNEPVKFIICLIIKDEKDGGNAHLQLIAKLSRNLMKEEFRDSLFNCITANQVLKTLDFLNVGK